jgi:hypothetical protein
MRLKLLGWLHRNLCGKLMMFKHIYACSEFCAARIKRDANEYANLL